MVFDVHVHTWRFPEHFNRAVIVEDSPPHRREWGDDRFARMYDLPIERYLELAEGAVDRGLLLGVKAGETLGIDIPNEYLAGVAAAHPERLSWACCVVPTREDAAAEVEHCVRELGAVAVGEMGPSYGNYRADDPRCLAVYEVARDLEVPVIIHAGPAQARTARLEFADLAALDNIAILFPTLTIVLCHLGYYRYEEGCHLVAKHPNVYGDISWLCGLSGLDRRIVRRIMPVVEDPYHHLLRPLLYYYSQTFGEPHKLLFGTDFPANDPRKGLGILEGINGLMDKRGLPRLPEEAIRRMLEENWKEVFPNLAGMRS